MQKIPAFILLILLVLACTKPLPDLSPIALTRWQEDNNGCAGVRSSVIEALESQKDELKGLSEKKIIELLGRPDRNELYKRNQKFYYYDLEPGKKCSQGADTNLKLIVRFNAMGMAKEVVIDRKE